MLYITLVTGTQTITNGPTGIYTDYIPSQEEWHNRKTTAYNTWS